MLGPVQKNKCKLHRCGMAMVPDKHVTAQGMRIMPAEENDLGIHTKWPEVDRSLKGISKNHYFQKRDTRECEISEGKPRIPIDSMFEPI